MIRVLVNGARGRMGQEAVSAVKAEEGLELVAETDIGDDLARAIRENRTQVVVDFTTASAGFANAKIIIEAGARPVIGTSGFREEQVRELQVLAKARETGGVIAPNFAIGAVLMMKFAQEAAKYLPHVEVIELHHDGKADSPSGTAVRTVELINQVRQKQVSTVKESFVISGARGAELGGVHIHSVRLPGLVAHQQVIFGGAAQTLTIQHDSLHRKSFMPGVVLACKKVVTVTELFYGLENLL